MWEAGKMHGQGRYVGEEGVVEGLWVAGEFSSLRDPDLTAESDLGDDHAAEDGWEHQPATRKTRKTNSKKKKKKKRKN